MTNDQAIEFARETLKQLATRKLVPTPENFERVYHELSETAPPRENRLAVQLLRALETLAKSSPACRQRLVQLQHSIEHARWERVPQQLIDFIQESLREPALSRPWGSLILELTQAWDKHTDNLPKHKKRQSLERLFSNFGNQPEELNRKLLALIHNWNQPDPQERASQAELQTALDLGAGAATANWPESSQGSWQSWQHLVHDLLKHGISPRVEDHAELLPQLEQHQARLEQLQTLDELKQFQAQMRSFMIALELRDQQEYRLSNGLSSLLTLLLENISQLNPHDRFLQGQIQSMLDLLAQQPLSIQPIYQLEASLRDIIRQQGTLKLSLDEATLSLRTLLDDFIKRISQLTDSTGEFQQTINQHSQRIKQASDLNEINQIIAALVADTEGMSQDLSRSHQELSQARDQSEAAEGRVRELERALELASAKVQEDQLTGAYNRRGLAEHFAREISRIERTHSPLCVALIDVDNFKQLNDNYGHLTGDDALVHLVDIIQKNIRPADVVARFGGEEFVLLMPETSLDEALEAVQRLQRELTKTFFLANNDRLVMTFSAGVAQWHLSERDMDVIARADQAMYRAKLAGKNRVESAEPPNE